MSGDCAQLPQQKDIVRDRLKKRFGNWKQRSHDSQLRHNSSQPFRVKAERDETANLLLKVQESRQKRVGKQKAESFRPRYSDQSSLEMRDSTDPSFINLKRKMEMGNGMSQYGGIYSGADPSAPSGDVFASPLDFNRDNGMEFGKKMKLDLTSNASVYNQAGSANNNNCNSGNLSHQQQANSFVANPTTPQDTFRDAQGSINSASNVPLEQNHNITAQTPLTSPFGITEQQKSPAQNPPTGDTNLSELLIDADLERLLCEISPGENNNEFQIQNQQVQNQQQPSQTQNNTGITNVNNQTPANGMNTSNPNQAQYYKTAQVQKVAPSPSAVQQMSPYTNPPSNPVKTPSGVNNQQPNNITSHHLQNLNNSIDMNFGSPDPQNPLMSQPVPVNRIRTPSSVDKVRHTPEGPQPVGGAMTPSPGSYSMPFPTQNPANNVSAPAENPSSFYKPISPRGQAYTSTAVGHSLNRSLSGQQAVMQNSMPQTNQGSFTNQSVRSVTPGATFPRGGMPMSPNNMTAPPSGNMTQQQMQQLQNRRMLSNMAEQRNAIALRNAEMKQQQAAVSMRNMQQGQQNASPNLSLTGQTSLALQYSNMNAATMAAQRAVAASQMQHETAAYPGKLPQYPNQGNSPGFVMQQPTQTKAMSHSCGNPNCTHNQQVQMMRNPQQNMHFNGLTRTMSGNQHPVGYSTSNTPPSTMNHLGAVSNQILHHPSSNPMSREARFLQQQKELDSYKMKLLAAQRRKLQQREMMSHPGGHMMSRNLQPGVVPPGEKAGNLMNGQMAYSKMNAATMNGASMMNEMNYRSAQSGVEQLHNVAYNNSYPNRTYSYTPPGSNFSSMPNEVMRSVSAERGGSTLQRSIPMPNQMPDHVPTAQMLANSSLSQQNMRNMYGTTQGMPSNAMLQRHGMVQGQMPHNFGAQNISANRVNPAAYSM